jgi:hypothetical protein
MVAILGKPWEQINPEDYLGLIKKLSFQPRIIEMAS